MHTVARTGPSEVLARPLQRNSGYSSELPGLWECPPLKHISGGPSSQEKNKVPRIHEPEALALSGSNRIEHYAQTEGSVSSAAARWFPAL